MTMDAYGILTAHGIGPDAFWEMSWGEVQVAMESMSKKRNEEARLQAVLAYKTADLIILGIGNMLSKTQRHYPSPAEAFPGLFDDVDVDQDWKALRDNFHAAFPGQTKER
jgi:hypothetical protein